MLGVLGVLVLVVVPVCDTSLDAKLSWLEAVPICKELGFW